jgi:hypothetical protein
MPEKVIAFTVTGLRQEYLRKSLDSWARARGVEDWAFVFCLEPCRDTFPVEAFESWARGVFPEVMVYENTRRLGCSANTRQAMGLAFKLGADFAVLAEEDVIVATDVLEYFAWARREYIGHPQVAVACAHTRCSKGEDLAAATLAPWFSPLVWGTWPGLWDSFIRPSWGGIPSNPEAWDANLRVVLGQAGRQCVFPARSRALHIGEQSTFVMGRIAEHMYQLSISDCFEPEVPPQDYREVPFVSVPELLV